MQRTLGPLLGLLLIACGGSTAATVDPPSDGYRLVTNADGSATGNGATCTYAGRSAAVGEEFAAPDGCNDCKCASNGAMCTQRACGSSTSSSSGNSSSGCTPGATRTIPNVECPAASASCTCQTDGTELCVAPAIACAPPPTPEKCPNGTKYSDGCNQCNCNPETGEVGCTKKACVCPAAGTTFNCQPIVPPERADACSGPYHEWLKKNCPEVKFVY